MKNTILHWAESHIRMPTVGIDLSERSMKYVKLRRGKQITIDLFGEIEIPEGIIVGGEIKNETELSKIIATWFSQNRHLLKTSLVVTSLPEEKSFLRIIQIPKVKQGNLTGAIRWEIEANIPLPSDEILYDYEIVEPLEDHADHFEVTITAFPKQLVESYVRIFKNVYLQPVALELESQAIVRATIPNLHEKKSRIIIDMGRGRTSLIVFSGNAIIFTTTVELGGNTLEENIMKVLNVPQEKAIQIKKETGLNKHAYGGEVFSALVPPLAALADELWRAVEYFKHHATHAHGADQEIDEILLTGGDANLAGLDTYLASALHMPVLRADSFAALRNEMNYIVPPIPKNQSLAFAAAIGLASRII